MSLNAKDFGVVGDGAWDNNGELVALRNHIRSGPDRQWIVEFEPGHYCYSDERWAYFGNRSVLLDFHNSKVECFSRAFFPLSAGPLTWDADYGAPHTVVSIAGDLIGSVQVGSDTAVLNAAVASNYQAGDRVLVAGYIQQFTGDRTEGWGWPPNFRYFEWKELAEVVDASTLRFHDPFRFNYDASWRDFRHSFNGQFYGAPRIWRCRLDDGRQVNRSLTIRNAHFIGGRDRAPGIYTPISPRGWHIVLENCTGDEGTTCWPSVAKRIDYRDCRFGGDQVELDKIVESVRFECCDFLRRVASGGGAVLDVSFRDCNFYDFVQATPRRSWRYEGCHFYDGVHLGAGLTNTPFALTGTASAV